MLKSDPGFKFSFALVTAEIGCNTNTNKKCEDGE